jgi:FtsZ-binding cell division protein ZapB
MTPEQQGIAEEFENAIESEYALCVREIKKNNQSIANNASSKTGSLDGVDCANLEIHSIKDYWEKRLDSLIDFIAKKDCNLNQQLAMKYLKGVRICFS